MKINNEYFRMVLWNLIILDTDALLYKTPLDFSEDFIINKYT